MGLNEATWRSWMSMRLPAEKETKKQELTKHFLFLGWNEMINKNILEASTIPMKTKIAGPVPRRQKSQWLRTTRQREVSELAVSREKI